MKISEKILLNFLKNKYNPENNPSSIGDDGCVLPLLKTGHKHVVSIDSLSEGSHFTRNTKPLEIGRKLASVSLSDIAAMGAKPVQLLVSLALPCDISHKWVQALYSGIDQKLSRWNVSLAGGDMIQSAKITVSSVCIGETILNRPLYRTGAVPGNYIYVTGCFGYSYPSGHHLNFTPRIDEIVWLLKKHPVYSLTDASDGLARSIEILTVDHGFGATVNLKNISIRGDRKSTLPNLSHALYDGEDFELVFCSKEIPTQILKKFQKTFNIPLSKVGTVTKEKKIDWKLNDQTVLFNTKSFDAWN